MAVVDVRGKTVVITVLTLVIVECVSLLAFVFTPLQPLVFGAVVIAAFLLSLWKPAAGVWIMLSELVVGGKGYLFSIPVGTIDISIRLGIFVAVLLAIIPRYAFTDRRKLFRIPYALWWWLAVFTVVYGVALGVGYKNPPSSVFLDANGYLFLAAAVPFFLIVKNRSEINKVFNVFIGALFFVTAKTFFVLLYFAHTASEDALRTVYSWIRVTGVGEITQFSLGWYRIFFQSHVFALMALFVSMWLLSDRVLCTASKVTRRVLWLLIGCSVFILIVSFSRSFWLAAGLTAFLSLVYLLRTRGWKLVSVLRPLAIGFGIVVAELAIVTFLVNLPVGRGGGGVSTISIIKERFSGGTEEVALSSRLNLLKPLTKKALEQPFFGWGFGTTVTYQTKDPRAAQGAGGLYTTYAFEWGYLDFVVKLGMIGALVFSLFPLSVLFSSIRGLRTATREEHLFILGITFAVIALLLTHATTPYLNHPLGIGYLLFLATCSAVLTSGAQRSHE